MFHRSNLSPLRVALLALVLASGSACSSMNSGPGTNPGLPRELDSGDLHANATYAHRFAAAGTYAYHCIYHAPMTGTVQVNAAAPDTLVNVSIVSSTMSFPAVSVKPGGRVVWSNNSGILHTVTSN